MVLFFLIIPVVVFAALAGLMWLLFHFIPIGEQQETRKGDLTDLSRIVSVLMTAGLGERSMTMSVYRRVTSLSADFSDDGVRLTLPLVTRQQKKRRNELLAVVGMSCRDAVIVADEDGEEFISGSIEGSAHHVSDKVKALFLKLFDVDDSRFVQFELSAYDNDLRAMGMSGFPTEEEKAKLAEYPTAPSAGADATKERDPRGSCFLELSMVLLWPIPFVIAFYVSGIAAASIVGLAEIIGWQIYRFYKHGKLPTMNFPAISMAATGLGCSLTLATGDASYVQLVPTVFCGCFALFAVYALAHGRTAMDYEKPKTMFKKGSSRLLVTASLCLVCILGATANEHLRMEKSLEAWIWYYAYFRLEFMVGFLFVVVPAAFLAIWRESEFSAMED